MVSIDSRINTARQEVDESLSKGEFLHNIVVTDNAPRKQYDFYCLSKDRRWASFGIGYDTLIGDFGDFAATISQAITLVHAQFPPIVDPDVVTGALKDAVQTTPSAPVQTVPATPDGAALFLPASATGAADPFYVGEELTASTGSIPTQTAATPAARPAASLPSSEETSVLPKRTLLDRALGTGGTARSAGDE